MYKLIPVLSLFLLLFCSANGQGDWHTYPFRDLARVQAGEQALYDQSGKADMVVSAKPFPSKTRVIYTGQKRPVSETGLRFMRIWAESRNVPASNVDFLLEEFLFRENDKEYWMPVHKNTAQSLGNSLKGGEEIVIYYFYLGGYNARSLHSKHEAPKKTENREPDGLRWLFAVERIEKPGSGFPLMSISEVVERNKPTDLSDIWIATQQIKAKVKAEFTGRVREISGKRKQIRDSWLEIQGAPGAARLMESEGLFKAGGKEYWIILRNQTREHLNSYVKKGDIIYLNTMFAGAVKNTKGVDWTFMTGEYATF